MEQQERNHGARKLMAAISFHDLGKRKPSPEELVEIAKLFNYEACAAFLARLNVCQSLAMASSHDKVVVETHKKLTSNVLSPSRLQEIVSAFGDKLNLLRSNNEWFWSAVASFRGDRLRVGS